MGGRWWVRTRQISSRRSIRHPEECPRELKANGVRIDDGDAPASTVQRPQAVPERASRLGHRLLARAHATHEFQRQAFPRPACTWTWTFRCVVPELGTRLYEELRAARHAGLGFRRQTPGTERELGSDAYVQGGASGWQRASPTCEPPSEVCAGALPASDERTVYNVVSS